MAIKEIPEILNIPDKLRAILDPDVFNKYRYFLLEGGRGSGKSQTVSRLFLYLNEKYILRSVCGREIQKNITESVHSLLADLIRNYQLNYEVFSNKIEHKEKGSTINFRGFREQGVFNIQGMEGVDLLWIDEAQAITKQTLDVLIPTIRKEKARVFFTMNRYQHNDPVYQMFAGRDDCLHIHIDYFENTFCTEALKKEATECKKVSINDYNHIWLGLPIDRGDDAVFTLTEMEDAKKNYYPLKDGYGMRLAGYDIARFGDDKCAAVIVQQMGALHWDVIYVDEWEHKDTNYTTGRIFQIATEYEVNQNVIDMDGGWGSGPHDTLKFGRSLPNYHEFHNTVLSYADDKGFGNIRTKNTYKIKDLLLKGHIHFTDDHLIDELMQFKYTFDHNQRRILISKNQMRKDGIKSPNRADALIMAVSLIGEVKAKQEDIYQANEPEYSKEDNLFETAGVK